MRADSLQPLPDVVTPICSGPSEWVERSVKEHRLGASATLTGMRSRRQRLEMWVPGWVRVAFCKTPRVLTLNVFTAGCDKDGIDNAVDLGAPKCSQVALLKATLDPLDLALVDTLDEAIVQCRLFGGDQDGLRANFERACAAGTGEGI
jgi:hypothetical protein